MRWIIKIILFPISLVLSILTAFLTFLLGIGLTILYFLMLMCIVCRNRLVYAESCITWY